MDKKFILLTITNYTLGLSILKMLYFSKYYNEALFFFPFIWFGFFVIFIKYFIPSNSKKLNGIYSFTQIKKNAIPNIILLFINSMFPIVALIYLGKLK